MTFNKAGQSAVSKTSSDSNGFVNFCLTQLVITNGQQIEGGSHAIRLLSGALRKDKSTSPHNFSDTLVEPFVVKMKVQSLVTELSPIPIPAIMLLHSR